MRTSPPGLRATPAVAAVCSPRTGLTLAALEGRAKAHQDYLAGDTLHGPVATWRELSLDRRQELVDQQATHLLALFEAPPPADPRPIDHADPGSPPFPDAGAERAYWLGRCKKDVDEYALMSTHTGAGPSSFVTGRHTEAHRWLAELRAPRPVGDDAATGLDEVARAITRCENRLEQLAAQATDDEPDAAKGAREEAQDWLSRVRWRQQARCAPWAWRRGGRGLVAALHAAGELPDLMTVDARVVVIAAHDHPYTAARDVVWVLQQWTGQPRPVCEHAIRDAVRDGLVDGRTPADVHVTVKGTCLYHELLGLAAAPSPTDATTQLGAAAAASTEQPRT
jgi:hypothetical protein